MNEKTLPKFVREKIRLADNGDIYSCFTVGNYYIDTKTLSVDVDKSNYYFDIVSKALDNADFRINSVELYDYKRFSRVDLNFSQKNTTVLIGNNGAGKSTILEAIAKNLQFLSDNIRIKNNNNYKFNESEINVGCTNGYSIVKCDIGLQGKYSFSCSLAKNHENVARKISSELEQFKVLGGMLQESDRLHGSDFPYPLMAYYPVERSITFKREEITKKQEKQVNNRKNLLSKIEGHSRAFDGTSNFDTFFNWFKDVDEILNEHKANNSYSAEDIKRALTNLKPGEDINSVLSSLITPETEVDDSYKSTLSNQLGTVKRAIGTFLTNVEDIYISRVPYLDMFVTKNGQKLSIFSLSQGEKTLLALVSDIARRLVTLNPNAENPLHGKGVVIIDELDLHLHPKWQQSIVLNLENTFPNLQFIISTHSPLILTTVTSEQIKILRDEKGKEVTTPETNPYGKVSAEALVIMDTPEKPQLEDELSIMLSEYEQLVKSGNEKEESTFLLKQKIESTGYTIDDSQLELWRFIASNIELFSNNTDSEEAEE
ncbi:AAA family ATPase [Photobacterium sanguinicancri]|uniref:AAA family ATPase n=1 Tax=Photobacterium sanguinicancri TaxID=875932 RepID=UPI0026E49342|nr:AAA family ATPase [Photobacterium sanguinicancri]MDO6498186.1 AAA family ATPase [Photobacterium sanguinicancri]